MSNLDKKIIYVFLGIFILVNIIFLLNLNSIIWDEASYISIGKYLYSSGNSGLNEVLRPIILPLIIGFFWKLGLNAIIVSKILAIIFSSGVLFLIYKLGEKVFGKKEGVIACFLTALTPVFLEYSSKVLTGIPSLFFALLALYFILDKKYALSGIFAGICFLTRFPQAIFFLSIVCILCLKFIKKPSRKKIKNIFIFGLMFSIVFIIYSVFNYFFYNSFTSSWTHAAFRPFYYLFWNLKYVTNLGNYNMPILFYLKELFFNNPVLVIFYFIGLYFIIKEKKQQKSFPIIFLSIMFFCVLTYLSNKQLRHAIIMLPYLALIAAKGITELQKIIKHIFLKKYFYYLLIMFVIVFLGFFAQSINFNNETPNMILEYYGFLKENPVNGNIFITDPLISAYYDHSVDAAYFDLNEALDRNLLEKQYDLIFYSEKSFPCVVNDLACEGKKQETMVFLLINYNLVFEKNYYGNVYYIFSSTDYIEKIPKTHLMTKYSLSKEVSLSKKPYDKLPVLIILEDFPSLNSNLSEIWENKKYLDLRKYVTDLNISVSADVIPTHLKNLNNTELEKLKNTKFEFIQNGYSHNESYKMSYKEEFEKIQKGKQIIYDKLNYSITAFTPPYYFSTDEKVSALTNLKYDIYITNYGDPIKVPFSRYDQTMSLIKVWETKKVKTYDEMKKEIYNIKNYQNYLLVSVYYYMLEDLSSFEEFINLTSDEIYMDVYEYDKWTKFIENTELKKEDSKLILSGENIKESKMTTLLFLNNGNYSLHSSLKEINIKNNNNELPIYICINENCIDLEPNQTYLLNV